MKCHQIDFSAYSPGARASSGGEAWLPQGQDWPRCGTCQVPMQLFVQFPVDGGWGSELKPGSQLSLFLCLEHGEPAMPPLSPALSGQLPDKYWENKADEYCRYHLRLTPPEAALAAQAGPVGVAPHALGFSAYAEQLQELGPESRRWNAGEVSPI